MILGVAFKPDVDDARNSPAERLIELLLERGASVEYNDPYVRRFQIGRNVFFREERQLESVPLTADRLQGTDCVVVVANHGTYDYAWIADSCSLLIDTRNATSGLGNTRADILRLGAPMSNQGSADGST